VRVPAPLGNVLRPLLDHEVLLILSVSTTLVMLGQGIVGPILPLFARSFGVSTAAIGLTLSAFALARMLTNVPSGLVADRWGRRILLIGGPLITGAGSLMSAFATGLPSLLLWRFVAGAGSAMYMTGAVIVVTDIATNENRGRLLAINQSALLLGITLGPAIGGVVAQVFDLRAPFIVVAVAAFVAAGWNFLRVPETRGLQAQEGPRDTPDEHSAAIEMRPLMLAFTANFMLIGLVSFGVFMGRSGRQTIVPLLGREEIGLGEAAVGGAFALMALINLVMTLPAGAVVDRFGVKRAIVPSALISAAGFMLFGFAGGTVAFFAAAVVLGIGSGMLGPSPPAYIAAVAPDHMRGAVMGMFRTVGDSGFVIAPPLVGYLADHAGYEWSMAVLASVMVFAALLFARFATYDLLRR
jgi:MFS family permease